VKGVRVCQSFEIMGSKINTEAAEGTGRVNEKNVYFAKTILNYHAGKSHTWYFGSGVFFNACGRAGTGTWNS